LDLDPHYPRNPRTFGEHVRKHRKEMGLLERELAEKLGVSVTTIKNWELGGKRPTPENMEKLGRLFPSVPAGCISDGSGKKRNLS